MELHAGVSSPHVDGDGDVPDPSASLRSRRFIEERHLTHGLGGQLDARTVAHRSHERVGFHFFKNWILLDSARQPPLAPPHRDGRRRVGAREREEVVRRVLQSQEELPSVADERHAVDDAAASVAEKMLRGKPQGLKPLPDLAELWAGPRSSGARV